VVVFPVLSIPLEIFVTTFPPFAYIVVADIVLALKPPVKLVAPVTVPPDNGK